MVIFWSVSILRSDRMSFQVSCIETASVVKSVASVNLAEIKEIGGKLGEGRGQTFENT